MGAGIWDAVRRGGPRRIRASLSPARIVTVTDRTTEDAALANLAVDPGVAVRQLAAGFDGRGHADPDATWHSGIKSFYLRIWLLQIDGYLMMDDALVRPAIPPCGLPRPQGS
jgi:hypothetical protein